MTRGLQFFEVRLAPRARAGHGCWASGRSATAPSRSSINDVGELGASSSTCSGVACSTTPLAVVHMTNIIGVTAGRQHSLADATINQTTQYTYDHLYRLTGDGPTSYSYDPAGNRASMVQGGTTTNYSYDKADRISAASSTRYTVNSDGNPAWLLELADQLLLLSVDADDRLSLRFKSGDLLSDMGELDVAVGVVRAGFELLAIDV